MRIEYCIKAKETQPHLLCPVTSQYGQQHYGELEFSEDKKAVTVRLFDRTPRRSATQRTATHKSLTERGWHFLLRPDRGDGFVLTWGRLGRRWCWKSPYGILHKHEGRDDYSLELRTKGGDPHAGIYWNAFIEGRTSWHPRSKAVASRTRQRN